MKPKKQKFRFFKAGKLDQLVITTPADLAAVEALDPKLWVAIAMPTEGIDADKGTLALIDLDHDGRIRVAEVKAAVAFVREHLADFSAFFAQKSEFPLSAIKPESAIRESSSFALGIVENPQPDVVSIRQAEEAFSNFAAQPFNGDGIITELSACGDETIAGLIKDSVAVTGGVTDFAGNVGITQEIFASVVADATAAIAWNEQAETEKEAKFPLTEKTEAAFAAIEAVRAKVEDFFARVHMASYSPDSVGTLNPSQDSVAQLAVGNLDAAAAKDFPIARVDSTCVDEAGVPVLPIFAGVNPAWASALVALRDDALVPALGLPADATSVTESQWHALLAKFSDYAAWMAQRPAGNIHTLSVERMKEIVAASEAGALADTFAKDLAHADHRKGLENLVRLARYTRDLLTVLRNYTSFADFYECSPKTIFLAGKLYLDERACNLCVKVADPAAHSALASKSNCCMVYCNCVRKSDGKEMKIVAVFGDGDSDYIFVGRNGVFVDKEGNDWDATIVSVVENSISLRQAIWAPYRKLASFIENQISNFASSREKKIDGSLSEGVSAPPAQKSSFDIGKFVGIFAAIGLAIGAIGGALVAIGSGFMSLKWWQMPLVIIIVLCIISLPSVIFTAMKLRRRMLGPILDANSWAINGRVKITIPLGKAYTEMPKKPAGSKVYGKDPYAEKTPKWKIFLWIVILLLIIAGLSLKFCPYIRGLVGLDNPKEQTEEVVVAEEAETTEAPADAIPAADAPAAEDATPAPAAEETPAPAPAE